MPYLGISVNFATREKPGKRWIRTAVKQPGKDVSERCVDTESRLLNAYGSPVLARGQNYNRVAARCEEDGSEARSVVNHVVRIFDFSFILKCMFLFARFFPFQFLTRTNETELS